MSQDYKVGMILENSLRQFAKIISVKNGVYGLSGWMTRENAEKATIAMKHVNAFGLRYAGVKVLSAGKASAKKSADSEPSDKAGSKTSTDKPATKPKAPKGAKGGAKKAAAKTSAKKSGKGKK